MRTAILALVPLVLSLAVPLTAQEAVTVSRYRLTLTVGPGGSDAVAVDLAKFEERCRDDDGCELTLAGGELPGTIEGAKNARLFVSQLDHLWFTNDSSGTNANKFPDRVFAVFGDSGECHLMDVDDFEGNDNTDAFALQTVATALDSPPFHCTLTVID